MYATHNKSPADEGIVDLLNAINCESAKLAR